MNLNKKVTDYTDKASIEQIEILERLRDNNDINKKILAEWLTCIAE